MTALSLRRADFAHGTASKRDLALSQVAFYSGARGVLDRRRHRQGANHMRRGRTLIWSSRGSAQTGVAGSKTRGTLCYSLQRAWRAFAS